MNELSIEQKAKAYDEALERAKEKYAMFEGMKLGDVLEDVFPELKESEDEKIKKAIIEIVKKDEERIGTNAHLKKIQWLEKQGERKPADKTEPKFKQKPADKVEPKFKVGDIITPKDRGHEPWQIMQVDILDKKYRFKDGYVIHFSQEDDYELVEKKPAWSEKDEYYRNIILYILNNECVGKTDKENAVNWFKSLKDRIQPKQEWSEKDERMLRDTIAYVEAGIKLDGTPQLNWLKSLKDK